MQVSNQPISTNDSHPKSLWLIGITYIMVTLAFGTINSLLVLYLTQVMGYSSHDAYQLFAAFNSLIFIMPVIGGYLADKFGYREATVIGMLLMIIGAALPEHHHRLILDVSLAAFAVGLATCTTTSFCMIDLAYGKQDHRRESGFTMFYLLFNIGFLAASILGGYISQLYSYRAAFLFASFASVGALTLFLISLSAIKPSTGRTLKGQADLSIFTNLLILALISTFVVVCCIFLLAHLTLNNLLLSVLVVAAVISIIILALKQKHRVARLKLFAFLLLSTLSVGFWALYMLEPSMLTIFIAHNVNRTVAGHLIPPSTFYGLNPFYIIVFGLIFSWLWRYLARQGKDFAIPTKFATSLLCMGIGYWIFVLGIKVVGSSSHLVNLNWIIFGYLFLTVAELLISPTGLSMVGRLSPAGKEGVLMGIWQLFMGLSAIVSGYLANIAVIPEKAMPVITNPIYASALFKIGLLSLGFGIIAMLIVPFIKKLIHSNKPLSEQLTHS